jgi:transcriptional regulator with XRE-family HTH domain
MAKLMRLRTLRERKPMTQEELAEAAGINRVTLANIESGRADPRPTTIRKLAAALGVEPAVLMGPEPESESDGQGKALAA